MSASGEGLEFGRKARQELTQNALGVEEVGLEQRCLKYQGSTKDLAVDQSRGVAAGEVPHC